MTSPGRSKHGSMIVLIGSTNPAKRQQLASLLVDPHVESRFFPNDVAPPPIEEGADSHLVNAKEKAIAWSTITQECVMASDGGLEVPILGTFWNSVFTKRSMGENLNDRERALKMLEIMDRYQGADRAISFVESIAIAKQGTILGSWEAHGLQGLISNEFLPDPHTPEGFWVAGLWKSGINGKRYWELNEKEMESASAPWFQLRPKICQLIRSLPEYQAG